MTLFWRPERLVVAAQRGEGDLEPMFLFLKRLAASPCRAAASSGSALLVLFFSRLPLLPCHGP